MADNQSLSDAEIQAMNFKRVDGIWYCHRCLGLPVPAEIREFLEAVEAEPEEFPDNPPYVLGPNDTEIELNPPNAPPIPKAPAMVKPSPEPAPKVMKYVDQNFWMDPEIRKLSLGARDLLLNMFVFSSATYRYRGGHEEIRQRFYPQDVGCLETLEWLIELLQAGRIYDGSNGLHSSDPNFADGYLINPCTSGFIQGPG